jgi:hypothetical protein
MSVTNRANGDEKFEQYLVGKPDWRRLLADLNVDERIILTRILEKQDVSVCGSDSSGSI